MQLNLPWRLNMTRAVRIGKARAITETVTVPGVWGSSKGSALLRVVLEDKELRESPFMLGLEVQGRENYNLGI